MRYAATLRVSRLASHWVTLRHTGSHCVTLGHTGSHSITSGPAKASGLLGAQTASENSLGQRLPPRMPLDAACARGPCRPPPAASSPRSPAPTTRRGPLPCTRRAARSALAMRCSRLHSAGRVQHTRCRVTSRKVHGRPPGGPPRAARTFAICRHARCPPCPQAVLAAASTQSPESLRAMAALMEPRWVGHCFNRRLLAKHNGMVVRNAAAGESS